MRFRGIIMSKYPYIFVDDDKKSLTYGMFSVRFTESFSVAGFKSIYEAIKYMENHK